MVDITRKQNTLREAVALAVLIVSQQETIVAIKNGTVPKGDVFAMSKAAGLLGVKKTPDLLPDCHPLPIEYTAIEYDIQGLEVHIKMTVKTIYKTGVEVEAMHGASVVALNMYDMLKPIDKNVSIGTIKLLSKKGGKSQFKNKLIEKTTQAKARVIVCSDSISQGKNVDRSGISAIELLNRFGFDHPELKIIPDEKNKIESELRSAVNDEIRLLIYSGGTGISEKDLTPQTLAPLLDIELPGISETIRRYGQDRMPFAMLSRSICGIKGQTIVLSVPGSKGGTIDAIESVCPQIFHLFDVLKGERHD